MSHANCMDSSCPHGRRNLAMRAAADLDAAVRRLLHALDGGEHERTTCYLLDAAALELGGGPLADVLLVRRDRLSKARAAFNSLRLTARRTISTALDKSRRA